MTAAEQSSEPRRDYASPATWGDVESVRHEVADLRSDVARMESSLDARITQVESSGPRLRVGARAGSLSP